MTTEKHFGVDLSTWQISVDYQTAKAVAGVEFALLRIGYGKNASQKDNRWEQHYAGCAAAGIPVGAYQYSYATSVSDAIAEARQCARWLDGYTLRLPVFLDLEEAKTRALGRAVVESIALAWIRTMREEGVEDVGIYSSPSWFSTVLSPEKMAAEGARIWCAYWGSEVPDIPGLTCWQFGGEKNQLRSTAVDGVGAVVDQDFWIGPLPEGDESMTVTCTKKTSTLDRNGKAEAGRYIAKGDVCSIKLAAGPLIEVVYPTPKGDRTAYLRSVENFRA